MGELGLWSRREAERWITSGWVASTIWNYPERFARAKDLVLRGLSEGKLKPVIARTFALDQIVQAHRFLESNEQMGKIVVIP